MKIRLLNWLVLINALGLVLMVCISLVDVSFIRVLLGFPFVLLFPGLALTLVIFPKKTSLDNAGFLAISLGLSIAVSVLLGLMLNYTPFRLSLESILYSTFVFTLAGSVIAWLRLRHLPRDVRRGIDIAISGWNMGSSLVEKAVTAVLLVVALATVGTIVSFAVNQRGAEGPTEFYILGLNGKTNSYPRELRVGERGRVLVGIINNEPAAETYRVQVSVDGTNDQEIGGITLGQGGKWEDEVDFMPRGGVQRCKVEFAIYRANETTPMFEPLNLWVGVTP